MKDGTRWEKILDITYYLKTFVLVSRFVNLMSEECDNYNKLKVGALALALSCSTFHIPGASLLQEEDGGGREMEARWEKEFETEASFPAEELGPVRNLPSQSRRRSC